MFTPKLHFGGDWWKERSSSHSIVFVGVVGGVGGVVVVEKATFSTKFSIWSRSQIFHREVSLVVRRRTLDLLDLDLVVIPEVLHQVRTRETQRKDHVVAKRE